MDDDLRALDMAQELKAQADTLGSALDQSGNIRDDKTVPVQIHHTQIRAERCKMVIRDLRPGIGHTGKKGGFPHIRKSHKPHIRDDLQLQKHLQLHGLSARLSILRRLHGGCGKMLVAQTAPSAL